MSFSPGEALRQAQALADAGASTRARELFQLVLEQDPANVAAREGLTALEKRTTAFDALLARYNKGDLSAVAAEGEALARTYPQSLFLLGLIANAHAGLKQPEAALTWLSRAAQLRPDSAETHNNIGKVLGELGRGEEAAAAFRRAVQLKPQYADAHYSLGVALRDLKRTDEAIACFYRALELKPDMPEGLHNLGVSLIDAGRYKDAVACLLHLTALKPEAASAHANLGTAFNKLHRYPDAIVALERAVARDPAMADARAQKIFLQAMTCDWDGLVRDAAQIPALGTVGPAIRPFVLLPLEDEPARHRVRAERYARDRFTAAPLPFAAARAPGGKIRLGYFSADFHDHAVMHVVAKFLERHDRSRFELHGFSFGPPSDDHMRQRAMAAMDHFHDVRALPDADIAQRARDLGIDIAIDLTGYTENGRAGIFARRAAPVQINFLGYMGTMGAPFMDYLIADAIAAPPAQRAHYTEKLIRLPGSFMPPDVTRTAAMVTRAEMGLPETGFVFASFNNAYKFTPQTFDIWARLLQAIDGSVLWLRQANPYADANLKRQIERRGIDPQRLIFAGRAPMDVHLGRHRLADLFLDTFAYNAHSSALDALAMGLPVLTLAGRGLVARVAASLVHAAGLPELAVDSAEDYERLALALASDPARLAEIRARLAAARDTAPLFDGAAHIRHMEAAYQEAHRRHLSGQPPEDFSV